ncbi:unnamed protein product [Dibothriocephalus latus]|uniref:Uncharacterized protein n=1 Tax=Dibothriocephalus latus TaxID=60516 RepID=A0A3P6T0R8_DIBLA|nr:unnamed protein product [Dibothriocephalus latus]
MRRDLKRNANDAMNCYLNFQHATHPVMFMEYGAYVLNMSIPFAIPHYEEMGRGLLIAALDMWCTNPWSRLSNCPCTDMLKLKPGTHKSLRALTSPQNSSNKYPLSGQKLRMAESVNYKLLRNWARRHTSQLAAHEGITFTPKIQKQDIRLPNTGQNAVLEVVPLTRPRGRNNAPSKTTAEYVCATPVSADRLQLSEITEVAPHGRTDAPSRLTPGVICKTPVHAEPPSAWSSSEPEVVPAKSTQLDVNELTTDSVRNQSKSSRKAFRTQYTTSSNRIMPTKRTKLVNGDVPQNTPNNSEITSKLSHKTVEFSCDGGKTASENEQSCQSHASLLPETSPRIRPGHCERRASLCGDFVVSRPAPIQRVPGLDLDVDASKVVRPASLPARSPHPGKLLALDPPKRCLEKPTPRKINSSTNNARRSTLDPNSTHLHPTVASVVIKSLDGGMVAYKGLAELDRKDVNLVLRRPEPSQSKHVTGGYNQCRRRHTRGCNTLDIAEIDDLTVDMWSKPFLAYCSSSGRPTQAKVWTPWYPNPDPFGH